MSCWTILGNKKEIDMDIYEKYRKLEDLPVKTIVKMPKTNKNLSGVVHILHGMCEHKERYSSMMQYFSERGYIVVISDMRGHGENVEYVKDLGYFGENGADLLISDVHAVNVFIHNNFPDLKIILVAHSMGAFIAKVYMKKYDADIDFLFLCGSVSDTIEKYAGLVVAEVQSLLFDDANKSRVMDYLMYNKYRKKFKNGSDNCWLSKDEDVVLKYNNDERCNFKFTINGYDTLFKLMIKSYSKKGWIVKNKNLPICFMAGREDVYVGNEEKLKKQVRFLAQVGYKNIEYCMFDNMRHEIFNEKDHTKVWDYMLNNLEKRL